MVEAVIPSVHFSVLGEIGARRDDIELDLGSPQQRAVAAVLILRHGRAVSMDDLVAALWDTPPHRPQAVVRTYVWRLRRLLEPAREQGEPWRLLTSVPGGYSLRLASGTLDWQLFAQRVAAARTRSAAGEAAAARDLFDAALALWRGTPLMGVTGPFADAERSRMEERRLDVAEARLEAMVELGACADAATELTAFVEAHPLREGPHYLLMRALYETGRQGEALAAYRRVHRLLAEELGIEPNARLQELHAEILAATTPSLRRTDVVSRRERVPRQIPHAVADFTGRAQETRDIREALLRPSAEAMPLVLVSGMGGTGKTALAMHCVQTVLDAYPDGQLYVDLRGADGSPADPASVLASFLRALGEHDSYIPAELHERAALYRSRLAQQRVLVVLDNAADLAQVTPLLPGSPTCAVVVTSRNGLATLPVSRRVILGALPPQEALRLLVRLIGAERVDAEPHTAQRILTACGGLPLAVRVIGSRLAARPGWTLEALAERLADEQHRLAELSVDTVAVESSFALGYSQLDRATRQALRLLAVPEHSLYDLRTASAVLDTSTARARPLLERLVAVGLLESPALDRYRYHDLVRLFARRLATETDSETVRHAALGRLLNLHLVTAAESYRLLRPGHTVARTTLPVAPGSPQFADTAEALAWSASTLDDILRLLTQAAASHTDRAATLLVMLDAVLTTSHLWHQVVPVAERLADAAARAGDTRSEARVRYMLGGALAEVGRGPEAVRHVGRAEELTRDGSDDEVRAMTLNIKGVLPALRSAVREAAFDEAVTVARRLGNLSLEAMALGNMIQTRLRGDGIDESTVSTAEYHLALHRKLGDRQGEGLGQYRYGQVLLRRELFTEAISAFLRSLELLEPGEHDYVRAAGHVRLSTAYAKAGNHRLAFHHADVGVVLSEKVGNEHLGALALEALGDALFLADRPQEAVAHWKQALAVLRWPGYEHDAARVSARLAEHAARGPGA
jgi:DNA-binding SARP family transcriptional activator